uniref:Uncharacterized protein n=1 Tax=Amphimedon queenslandica TaxID=400682 RepID=A0A1X7V7Y5_AMPQE
MHLVSVEKMLNLFAETGHFNHPERSRLFLQQMLELPTDYSWLYNCIRYRTLCRSSRYWASLWTNLTIKQIMIRSIKSCGGLTRGHGSTESVQLQRVYSI